MFKVIFAKSTAGFNFFLQHSVAKSKETFASVIREQLKGHHMS